MVPAVDSKGPILFGLFFLFFSSFIFPAPPLPLCLWKQFQQSFSSRQPVSSGSLSRRLLCPSLHLTILRSAFFLGHNCYVSLFSDSPSHFFIPSCSYPLIVLLCSSVSSFCRHMRSQTKKSERPLCANTSPIRVPHDCITVKCKLRDQQSSPPAVNKHLAETDNTTVNGLAVVFVFYLF